MSAHPKHRLAALALAASVLVGLSTPAAAAPAALPDPPGSALDWIEGELADDGGNLRSSFDGGPPAGIQSFDDWGLTIDAILALAADGRGDESAASTAAGLVEANVASYVTGGEFGPDDRYAGALAKTLLMAQIQGDDGRDFNGFDLPAELLARLRADGPDAGRFSDKSFGDFSNGFSQALALLALDRTPGGAPASAVEFLLAQQCPGGSFRGDYTTPGGCTADTAATVDATGFALQALVAVEPTCATRQAVADAVDSLISGQNAGGSFGGESGSNANSTGLAAVALRSLGETGAADEAAGFIAGLQLQDGDDLGAIALNQAGLTAAADGVEVLERDGFRRATTQGVLAFGLPTYGEIGAEAVDPAALAPCGDSAPEDPGPVVPPAPSSATATLSATSVRAGDDLTVTGTGFIPGEAVSVTLYSTPVEIGSVTADAAGQMSFTFTVPSDIEPGDHRVELVGQRSGARASATFVVLGVESARTLPATGRTTGAQAGAGAALVMLGAALVALARRQVVAVAPQHLELPC